MNIVREYIDVFPFDTQPVLAVQRREDLLLATPAPAPGVRAREYRPIEVVHFGAAYVEQAFAPPRGVYESDAVRIEWQNMNGRQPFYHRNCGVDELSYQVCGDRTLMTEMGSVELAPGDFARIPDGVAHDNFGRLDIHLLFYVPSPLEELNPAVRTSEYKAEPFPGWKAKVMNELTTEGVGGPGQDVMLAPADEQMLLDTARDIPDRIHVLRPEGDSEGVQWLYRSDEICVGRCAADFDDGRIYKRHRNAHEIQYQVRGERTLVTQRGAVRLSPGDFVQIPLGVAFTSVHAAASEYLAVASTRPIPQVGQGVRHGVRLANDELDALRRQVDAARRRR